MAETRELLRYKKKCADLTRQVTELRKAEGAIDDILSLNAAVFHALAGRIADGISGGREVKIVIPAREVKEKLGKFKMSVTKVEDEYIIMISDSF